MTISAIVTLPFAFLSVWLFTDVLQPMAVLGMAMAVWIIVMHCFELYERATHRHSFFTGLGKLGRSHWAMVLGHIGMAVSVIGITLVSNYDIERDVRLAPGESVQVQGYDFNFAGLRDADGPNYDGYIADFNITRDGDYITTLHAEKRYYSVAGSMMTEAAIDSGVTRDLYVAMGEKLDGTNAWAVRIYYKPFVNWIWFGATLMALGGAFAISDKRYRFRKKASKEAQAEAKQEAKVS